MDGLFYAVAAKDRRIVPAAGPAQPLAQARHGRRRSDLRDARYGADIDSQLKGRRANGCRGALALLQHALRFLPDLPRKATVVRPELIGETLPLAASPQQVGEQLDVAAAVRKNEIVPSPERREKMLADRQLAAGHEILELGVFRTCALRRFNFKARS